MSEPIRPEFATVGSSWRWRHQLIRNGEWSRLYKSRTAAQIGFTKAFRSACRSDRHACVEIDGARAYVDPNASPEVIEAIRELVEAVKRMTPEQIAELSKRARETGGRP